MKLIEKIKKELINTGLFILEEDLDNEPFVNIYQKEKHIGNCEKSIGCIFFNKRGTKITDISFHNRGVNALYLLKHLS